MHSPSGTLAMCENATPHTAIHYGLRRVGNFSQELTPVPVCTYIDQIISPMTGLINQIIAGT